MSTDVNTQISPALHPAVIDGADHDPVLQQVQNTFRANYVDLEKIHQARQAAVNNPLLTKDAATLKVSTMAEKIQVQIFKRFDQTNSILRGAIEELNRELARPITDASTNGIGAEIRAHVKAMTSCERNDFMQKAVVEQDLPTLRSVLGSPAYLSGMDKSMQAEFTHQFNARRDPEAVKRLNQLEQAGRRLDSVGIIHPQIEKAIGASWAAIDNLKKQQRKLDKAFGA